MVCWVHAGTLQVTTHAGVYYKGHPMGEQVAMLKLSKWQHIIASTHTRGKPDKTKGRGDVAFLFLERKATQRVFVKTVLQHAYVNTTCTPFKLVLNDQSWLNKWGKINLFCRSNNNFYRSHQHVKLFICTKSTKIKQICSLSCWIIVFTAHDVFYILTKYLTDLSNVRCCMIGWIGNIKWDVKTCLKNISFVSKGINRILCTLQRKKQSNICIPKCCIYFTNKRMTIFVETREKFTAWIVPERFTAFVMKSKKHNKACHGLIHNIINANMSLGTRYIF